MNGAVRVVDTDAEREAALAVRYDVFVEGQGVPESVELDGRDGDATHFLAVDEHPVGTARLRRIDDRTGKVERVAVREGRRGDGWGRRLMQAIENEARTQGLTELVLHAQTTVEEFYRHLGYETTSDRFTEAGIEHVEMRTRLD